MLVTNVVRWDISKRTVSMMEISPTDNQQAQSGQSPSDSYDPVVGKWMTNLVATTPVTSEGHEKSMC